MASTNKTTNYELSQYIGTDKPTYLTDYNQDMTKIDAGIHAAKSEADTNATSIGTLSNLTTTAKNNLVSSINEVDADTATNANNIATNTSNIAANTSAIGTLANLTTTSKTNLVVAANEINAKVGNLSALQTDTKTSTVGAINEVVNKFIFTHVVSPTHTYSTGLSHEGSLTIAYNSDGSLFKIYGGLNVWAAAWSEGLTVTLSDTGLPEVDEDYTINAAASSYEYGGTVNYAVRSITYKQNGNIVLNIGNFGNNTYKRLYFPPCLYINTNFGDIPEE